MGRSAILKPSGQSFRPAEGSWLHKAVNEVPIQMYFVTHEDDPELIIGSVRARGRGYVAKLYDKPLKATSKAKTEPKVQLERKVLSVSSAVWDLRRQAEKGKEAAAG